MIISGMTCKDITKNICSCNIKECPRQNVGTSMYPCMEYSSIG